ncbi:MAG: IclR family transcriptional regulator [Hydrogenophaga sp.]|jgi:DNA-binding IclR family transcriptional regulator|uniref:IclR family transcriptional regulator n=1 Tax=Hydrogenophaga sp. TaxID=1904254 RepID=UPI001DDCA6AA|nr:IclR family transcriptional regulator [Hydrogenophaga sp.]MBW0170569.1 IclR family transcriptional regulator [Hydrogenophaga sp.]MBW0182945.1 IclR family transcriptional regulator [Hydrogenophaga sp.]
MRNTHAATSPRLQARDEEAENSGPSTGSVVAVQRAMQLLDAFALGEAKLSLADISRRCAMHKTTALRILRTLAAASYVVPCENGAWRLGPAAGWLGARYQSGFDVQDVVEPMLRKLSKSTRESAAFYVREGDVRTCLMRVEGVQPLRHHARMGEALPLDKGSPGRVILAFSGERGAAYERIRQQGYCLSIGEREKGVATVSAPVFGAHWKLLGSVCISGPAARLTEDVLEMHAKAVINAANALSYALAGSVSASTPTVVSTWHPPS